MDFDGKCLKCDRRLSCTFTSNGKRDTQYHTKHGNGRSGEAVDALMAMFEQYCDSIQTTDDRRPMYDHDCMSAGEDAADVLLRHGKISLDQLVRT